MTQQSLVFYTADGTITQTQVVPDFAVAAQVPLPGMQIALIDALPADRSDFMASFYVLAGAVIARQTMTPSLDHATIAADGVAVATITGLPDPCSVSITGVLAVAPTTVTGGTISLTANAVGDLNIMVTAAPAYLPWSTTVHAI
jgi:hypothetical protein